MFADLVNLNKERLLIIPHFKESDSNGWLVLEVIDGLVVRELYQLKVNNLQPSLDYLQNVILVTSTAEDLIVVDLEQRVDVLVNFPDTFNSFNSIYKQASFLEYNSL